MSDANVAVLLADEKAHWVDSTHLGLLPDENIVREWRNLNIQTRTECIAHLKSRTTVTNPKAQTKEYSGIWRVLKIEDIVERNKQGGVDGLTIRETLADGYASTLVDGLPRLAEDDTVVGSGTTEAANIAHPGGTAAVQEDWRTITIRWKDLNHDSLEAIRAERTAVTAATLTVGAETKTGPWFLIRRKPSWEDDGTGVYEETWSLDEWHMESKGKTGNTKVVVNRYVQNVPKDRVKTVLDAEIAACTGYGTQGYTYDQKLYWRDLYADIITEVSQAVKIEITAFTAELDASKTVSEKSGENLYDADISAYETTTAAQGHIIRTQKSRNSDGTLNASKTDALAVKQEVALYTAKIDAASTVSTKAGKNLFTADLTSYADPTVADGHKTSKTKVVNSDGTFEIQITDEVASKQEWAGSTFTNGNYATKDGTVNWWRGKAATLADINTIIGTAALTDSTNNVVSITKRDDNLYDYDIEKRPYSGGFFLWTESTLGPKTRVERQYAKIWDATSTVMREVYSKRDVTITYYIYIKHSYADAESAISGGLSGSKVDAYKNGGYVGIKVTDISEGVWTADESR